MFRLRKRVSIAVADLQQLGVLVSACAHLAGLAGCRDTRPTVPLGVYVRRHQIEVNPLQIGRTDTAEWQTIAVSDCLHLRSAEPGTVEFVLVVVRDNLHSCTIEGTARGRGSLFEWVPPDEDRAIVEEVQQRSWPCRLRLRFLEKEIAVEDVDDHCRTFYCGVRASADARFDLRSRTQAATACEEAPTPDLDAAERMAEQFLGGLPSRR